MTRSTQISLKSYSNTASNQTRINSNPLKSGRMWIIRYSQSKVFVIFVSYSHFWVEIVRQDLSCFRKYSRIISKWVLMFWPVLSHKARCNAPVLSGTVCSDLISMMHVKIISESRSEPLTAGNYMYKARLLKSYSNAISNAISNQLKSGRMWIVWYSQLKVSVILASYLTFLRRKWMTGFILILRFLRRISKPALIFLPVFTQKARYNAPVWSGTLCSVVIAVRDVKITSESRSKPPCTIHSGELNRPEFPQQSILTRSNPHNIRDNVHASTSSLQILHGWKASFHAEPRFQFQWYAKWLR